MSNITWDHFEVQRAATDAAYASFALNGVSLSSPATGSKAQATLNEKMQGLKQAIEDMSEAANAMSAGLKAADKAFEDNEQQCKVKITKSARFLDNSSEGLGLGSCCVDTSLSGREFLRPARHLLWHSSSFDTGVSS